MSNAAITLTRMSISTFESYQTASAISESRMLSLETLKCLFNRALPGAGKIHATLDTQCPEVYGDYMEWINNTKSELRDQVKRELEAESQKRQESQKDQMSENSNYNFNVSLSAGDSVTLCVKKAKKM
eukprot:355049-Amphidinium_carterae.1